MTRYRTRSAALWLCAFLAAGSVTLPVTAGAQDTAEPRFDEVIADLNENNLTAEEIRATDRFDRLVVVDVGDFVEGGEIQALQETLRMTEDGFAEVQTAIEANERFEAEIKRRSIELRRVFAATRSDDGTITIYVGPTGLVL